MIGVCVCVCVFMQSVIITTRTKDNPELRRHGSSCSSYLPRLAERRTASPSPSHGRPVAAEPVLRPYYLSICYIARRRRSLSPPAPRDRPPTQPFVFFSSFLFFFSSRQLSPRVLHLDTFVFVFIFVFVLSSSSSSLASPVLLLRPRCQISSCPVSLRLPTWPFFFPPQTPGLHHRPNLLHPSLSFFF